jgi:hypothetical protein
VSFHLRVGRVQGVARARLETTRRYSLPTDKDKADALNLITIDR